MTDETDRETRDRAWAADVRRQNAEMMGPLGDHEHIYGPVERAWITGNPHRKCLVDGCRFVSLDLSDDDDD